MLHVNYSRPQTVKHFVMGPYNRIATTLGNYSVASTNGIHEKQINDHLLWSLETCNTMTPSDCQVNYMENGGVHFET